MNPWRLDDRVAVVTGGSRGIGAAIVSELLDLGAEVIAVARGADGLAALAARHPGARLHTVAADLATTVGRQAVVDVVARTGGRLHALVLNHGIAHRQRVTATTLADSLGLMAVNYDASVQLAIACHPAMREAGSAAIVAVGSIAGRLALPDRLNYGASKAALEQAMRALALAWGGDGIRANTVLPYFTRTPMVASVLEDPSTAAAVASATALDRIGEPEEVARAAAFLALPAASYCTGQALAVDGGFSSVGLAGLGRKS